MADNEEKPNFEESSSDKEEETEAKEESSEESQSEEREDAEKSFVEAVKSTFGDISEQLSTVVDSQKSIIDAVSSINNRVKALETPSDLPLSPKGTQGGDDVGASVKVPEEPYPQGKQAKLDDDGKETINDQSKLSIQGAIGKTELVQKSEHTFTTETPRPNAALENVDKSASDLSPILKDAREAGFESLSTVARNILNGKYYVPTADEVGRY
jgi:hypothetical protein